MTVSALLKASLVLSEIGSNTFGGPNFSGSLDMAMTLGDGTGLGQFTLPYIAERTVASNTDDNVDLNAVLASALGVSFAATKLVGIFIINRQKDGTANTTTLTLGGGSNKVVGLFDSMVLQPGGFVFAACDAVAALAAITAATGDILRITNSTGAVNKYLIGLLGRP